MNTHTIRQTQSKWASDSRRGAVAVEFAIVAPVLLTVVLGLLELTRAYDTANLLEMAAREGARLASMDREGLVEEGESSNDKVINDMRNFLASNGLDPDDIDVEIIDHENPPDPFDLDDPNNDLRLFDVNVSIDFSSVSLTSVPSGGDYPISASLTFRNGHAVISQ